MPLAGRHPGQCVVIDVSGHASPALRSCAVAVGIPAAAAACPRFCSSLTSTAEVTAFAAAAHSLRGRGLSEMSHGLGLLGARPVADRVPQLLRQSDIDPGPPGRQPNLRIWRLVHTYSVCVTAAAQAGRRCLHHTTRSRMLRRHERRGVSRVAPPGPCSIVSDRRYDLNFFYTLRFPVSTIASPRGCGFAVGCRVRDRST